MTRLISYTTRDASPCTSPRRACIRSSAARFADTHARIGIAPGWGLSQKLSRAIGIYRAREVSLTGNFVSAAQAEAWGLVNRVVAPEELLPQARQMAQDMLSVVPAMLRRYKAVINDGFALELMVKDLGIETQ